jgi:hypothetical protein
MRYEIETYKGQLIEYDDDYDKFVCDISIEDKFKSSKRLSLKDIRKEIDNFIKLNADFKPFKIIMADRWGSVYVKDVVAIRTDGKFVVKTDGGTYSSHLGMKEMMQHKQYDAEIMKKIEKTEQDKKDIIDKYDKQILSLSETLKDLDLSRYEHIINQE